MAQQVEAKLGSMGLGEATRQVVGNRLLDQGAQGAQDIPSYELLSPEAAGHLLDLRAQVKGLMFITPDAAVVNDTAHLSDSAMPLLKHDLPDASFLAARRDLSSIRGQVQSILVGYLKEQKLDRYLPKLRECLFVHGDGKVSFLDVAAFAFIKEAQAEIKPDSVVPDCDPHAYVERIFSILTQKNFMNPVTVARELNTARVAKGMVALPEMTLGEKAVDVGLKVIKPVGKVVAGVGIGYLLIACKETGQATPNVVHNPSATPSAIRREPTPTPTPSSGATKTEIAEPTATIPPQDTAQPPPLSWAEVASFEGGRGGTIDSALLDLPNYQDSEGQIMVKVSGKAIYDERGNVISDSVGFAVDSETSEKTKSFMAENSINPGTLDIGTSTNQAPVGENYRWTRVLYDTVTGRYIWGIDANGNYAPLPISANSSFSRLVLLSGPQPGNQQYAEWRGPGNTTFVITERDAQGNLVRFFNPSGNTREWMEAPAGVIDYGKLREIPVGATPDQILQSLPVLSIDGENIQPTWNDEFNSAVWMKKDGSIVRFFDAENASIYHFFHRGRLVILTDTAFDAATGGKYFSTNASPENIDAMLKKYEEILKAKDPNFRETTDGKTMILIYSQLQSIASAARTIGDDAHSNFSELHRNHSTDVYRVEAIIARFFGQTSPIIPIGKFIPNSIKLSLYTDVPLYLTKEELKMMGIFFGLTNPSNTLVPTTQKDIDILNNLVIIDRVQ